MATNRGAAKETASSRPLLSSVPARILILALAYFTTGRLSLLMPLVGNNISDIWLPAGIAVAGIQRWGWRCFPGVLFGSFLLNISNENGWVVSFAISIGATLSTLVTVHLLRGTQIVQSLTVGGDLLQLSARLSAGTSISAIVGTLSLYLGGIVPADAMISAGLKWWLGDLLGMLVMAPFLLTVNVPAVRAIKSRSVETFSYLGVLGLVTFITFFANSSNPIAFLPIPILVWAALRLSPMLMSGGALTLNVAALVATASGKGPFGHAGQWTELILSLFLVETTAIGWLTTAVVAKGDRAQSRFNEVYRLPLIGIAITSPQRIFLDVNDALAKMLGYIQADLIGKSWTDITHPQDVAENNRLLEEMVARKSVGYRMEKRFIRADGSVMHADVSARSVPSASGEIDHLVKVVQDITERKAAEIALRRSNEFLSALRELTNEMLARRELQPLL